MGVTIHYHGTLDDVSQVGEMEDRVIDLVFALGGRATIWRSYADHDPDRVARGLMVEMTPGQDTFSLLVSPEGHLTPLFQIEQAEQAAFDDPPYCFVKTQFGSITGHVAIVHLLDALKERYASNLTVSDEGEYYETRDIQNLRHKKEFLDGAIRSMADGLREHGLSEEAMEDPDIVARRIERVAMLVQQKMQGVKATNDTESPTTPDEDFDDSLEDEVHFMDNLRRHNDLRSERMSRRMSEAVADGMSTEEALRLAMQEVGLGAEPTEHSSHNEDDNPFDEPDTPDERWEQSEPWQQSLPENPFDDSAKQAERDRHPAVLQAQAFLLKLMELDLNESEGRSFLRIACGGAGDMVGGLVQATCDDLDSRISRALAITQLKRALKGYAFARGAIFGLRSANKIDKETSEQLHARLETSLDSIHCLMSEAWNE